MNQDDDVPWFAGEAGSTALAGSGCGYEAAINGMFNDRSEKPSAHAGCSSSSGYALRDFESSSSRSAGARPLHGNKFICPPSSKAATMCYTDSPPPPAECKLSVMWLPLNLNEASVEALFSEFGAVYEVAFARSPRGTPSGCAFVTFFEASAAAAAATQLNGKYVGAGSRPLQVQNLGGSNGAGGGSSGSSSSPRPTSPSSVHGAAGMPRRASSGSPPYHQAHRQPPHQPAAAPAPRPQAPPPGLPMSAQFSPPFWGMPPPPPYFMAPIYHHHYGMAAAAAGPAGGGGGSAAYFADTAAHGHAWSASEAAAAAAAADACNGGMGGGAQLRTRGRGSRGRGGGRGSPGQPGGAGAKARAPGTKGPWSMAAPNMPGTNISSDQCINVYVYNLPGAMGSAELGGLFERFGNVVFCHVYCDKTTGRSRGFGCVTFTSLVAAEEAISNMDNYLVGRKRIFVSDKKVPLSEVFQRAQSSSSAAPTAPGSGGGAGGNSVSLASTGAGSGARTAGTTEPTTPESMPGGLPMWEALDGFSVSTPPHVGSSPDAPSRGNLGGGGGSGSNGGSLSSSMGAPSSSAAGQPGAAAPGSTGGLGPVGSPPRATGDLFHDGRESFFHAFFGAQPAAWQERAVA